MPWSTGGILDEGLDKRWLLWNMMIFLFKRSKDVQKDNHNLYWKDSVDFSLKQHSKQAIEIKTAWKKTLYWLINQNVFIGNRKWLAIDTDPCNSLSLGLTHSQTDQLMFAVKSDWHKSVQLFVGRFDRLDARPYQSGQISGQFCISSMLTIFFSVYLCHIWKTTEFATNHDTFQFERNLLSSIIF